MLTLIESDNNLSEKFKVLTEALQEDEVVHELAEVPPGGGKKLRSLTLRWYNTVKKWVMRTEIHMTRGVAPGTLALLARARPDGYCLTRTLNGKLGTNKALKRDI